jgi:hypothetical protein
MCHTATNAAHWHPIDPSGYKIYTLRPTLAEEFFFSFKMRAVRLFLQDMLLGFGKCFKNVPINVRQFLSCIIVNLGVYMVNWYQNQNSGEQQNM